MDEGGETCLEFSVVVFVYDRFGVCWLAEPALGELREGNVEARTEGVCDSELDLSISVGREIGGNVNVP